VLKKNKKKIWIILFVLISLGQTLGQFSISNIAEYQLGNLPNVEPKNLSTLYDQINIKYSQDMFRLFTKVEMFQSADKTKSYADFVQKGLSIKHENLGLTVGNFYHIIGRGLLLRSYEIPGTVLEDFGLRTRYGFYRDMDGIIASYSPDFAEIYAFRGRPLNNLLPPTFSNDFRRPKLLEGIESRIFISQYTFSGSYLRENSDESYDEYGSLAFEAALPFDLQLYAEYAQQFGGENKNFDISSETAHALYFGANWLYHRFGASYEYKSYNEFLLGYNDPPPLVKEHQYLLLNRSTHRIIPINETGWQAEVFYGTNEGHTANLNFSESVNELVGNRNIFQEQFFELSYFLTDITNIKGFFDHSIETLFAIEKRYTVGSFLQTEFSSHWSISLDLQYQQFNQTVGDNKKVKNYAALISVSRAPDLSFGFVFEKSNDPVDVPEGKEEEYWIGGNLAYQYSQVHLITLFLGKRRGGNACTSGICYEILPFEGMELRLTSNL
jgi:hypothetical protein